MNGQRRLLPSMSMLSAFDAAASTGSFTAAANKLNLTQGAISRQINKLETLLGVSLFDRTRQSIELTETGKTYALDINQALQAIRSASLRAITNPQGGLLNLAILPTFSTRWLMPRLASFLLANPDVTVNFMTKLIPFDFADEQLHAAIHYGKPDWPKADNTFLMDEEVVPVCSPDFLAKHPLTCAKDLAPLPLLHISTRPNEWVNWFKANDMDIEDSPGMHFEQFSQVAKAAAAGLGAALLPKFLIQTELDNQELVEITDHPIKSTFGYYLVTPNDLSDYAPVVAFRQWLLTQVNR
ncbi:MAG: LysR family transcriptional regulator [Algicola sp.]|nr:LysR family transcriptional regulator [Algicola sp.]